MNLNAAHNSTVTLQPTASANANASRRAHSDTEEKLIAQLQVSVLGKISTRNDLWWRIPHRDIHGRGDANMRRLHRWSLGGVRFAFWVGTIDLIAPVSSSVSVCGHERRIQDFMGGVQRGLAIER